MEQTRGMFCTCDSGVSITTPVTLLANEFHVRNVLHGQVSLAAVNQILGLLLKCKYLVISMLLQNAIVLYELFAEGFEGFVIVLTLNRGTIKSNYATN